MLGNHLREIIILILPAVNEIEALAQGVPYGSTISQGLVQLLVVSKVRGGQDCLVTNI
jgi:hypothetical protein